MTSAARLFLLIVAAGWIAFIATAGLGFADMAEPARTDAGTYVFWTLAALLVSAPLWIPALVPHRHPRFFKICRWLSAVALVMPVLLLSRMFQDQVAMNGIAALVTNPGIFGLVLALLAGSLTSWTLLLQPELTRLGDRIRSR